MCNNGVGGCGGGVARTHHGETTTYNAVTVLALGGRSHTRDACQRVNEKHVRHLQTASCDLNADWFDVDLRTLVRNPASTEQTSILEHTWTFV